MSQCWCSNKTVFTLNVVKQLYPQLMRFAESEPESILWPDLTISDNVATKRSPNLWRPNHGLCQQDSEPTETEVPERHGWQRNYKVFDQGGPSCKRSSWHFSQGEQDYDAYKKDIAIVNIFFGEPTVYGEMNWLSPFEHHFQSLRDLRRWLCWISSLALEDSVDFALGSALANCPAAFLSYFHCGFVMKYSRRW